MTKPYSEMAGEIIKSVPESCFSNNSYREWRRSREVLMSLIAEALEAVAKERDEENNRVLGVLATINESELNKLRLRLERMREALKNISNAVPEENPNDAWHIRSMVDVAKQALEGDLDE